MKYIVTFEAKAFYYVEVEAEDEIEAAEVAVNDLPPVLGICCDGYGQSYSLILPDDPGCWEEVEVREMGLR